MSLAPRSDGPATPRIAPGRRAEIGWVATLLVAVLGRVTRTDGPPNIFATLARHRRLFRPWLRFAAALMPRGTLPRADTELVILRVAHNCSCKYEWAHHERLAQRVGLTAERVDAVRKGPLAEGWTHRQELLLSAADELHDHRELSDGLWSELAEELTEVELIELPMLVGHYEMLAMTLNSLRVQPDRPRQSASSRSRRGRRPELAGRRILVTGAARGIGAATAKRLHERGATVVLAGIEPAELARVAADCGGALAVICDTGDRGQVEAAVEAAVERLGGLDVVIANAGVPVNLLGVHHTLRAAGPHISHPRGYALAIASLAAAVHPPLRGAHSASNAGVEALADALRAEIASSGAKVGVAYFGELDTGADAIERAIARRSRRAVAPRWVAAVLPLWRSCGSSRRP
jgi:AhpD family alkylhydroperoxidase